MISYVPAPFLPQPDGMVAVVAPYPNDYKRGDKSASQPGDVYSLQGDGSWQVRSQDQISDWEKGQRDGAFVTYKTGDATRVLMPVQG